MTRPGVPGQLSFYAPESDWNLFASGELLYMANTGPVVHP